MPQFQPEKRKEKEDTEHENERACQCSRCSTKENPPSFADPSHILSCEGGASILTLPLQDVNFLVQVHYESLGSIHGGNKSGPLTFPPFQAVDLGASPSELGLNLFAEAALAVLVFGHVHEFHTARLACAILVIAPMGEVGPAPVSARISLLVVKTHAYQSC